MIKTIRPRIGDYESCLKWAVTWKDENSKTYRLIQDEQANLWSEFLPPGLIIQEVNGMIIYDDRLFYEEGKDIAAMFLKLLKIPEQIVPPGDKNKPR